MVSNSVLQDQAIINAEAGPIMGRRTLTTLTTAGALTLTAAQIAGGLIARDPNGAGRIDTLPTAALLVAYFRNLANQRGTSVPVGLYFEFAVQNDADAAETITIAVGSGGTATAQTLTIAQSNSKRFGVLLTNVTPGSEAYFLRNLGTYTT
jgi:hypothetical protein